MDLGFLVFPGIVLAGAAAAFYVGYHLGRSDERHKLLRDDATRGSGYVPPRPKDVQAPPPPPRSKNAEARESSTGDVFFDRYSRNRGLDPIPPPPPKLFPPVPDPPPMPESSQPPKPFPPVPDPPPMPKAGPPKRAQDAHNKDAVIDREAEADMAFSDEKVIPHPEHVIVVKPNERSGVAGKWSVEHSERGFLYTCQTVERALRLCNAHWPAVAVYVHQKTLPHLDEEDTESSEEFKRRNP